MKNPIRGKDGKMRPSAIIATTLVAMIVAMVPAIMAFSGAPVIKANNFGGEARAAEMNQKPYVTVFAGNALYEPNAGKTNVFGPGGIFPFFNDTFSCGNAITCGVQVEGDKFRGVFKEAGMEGDNKFTAEYVAPITYGDQQTAGHKYRIELVDTVWNNADSKLTPAPTRVPQFLAAGNGVAFDQIQHGHSMIDRADVPMFMNRVALYGHVNVYDVSAGNKLVAEKIFVHLMVGKVIDEKSYFSDMQANPATQTVVAIFVVNIPSGVKLPGGIGPLTPEQAQGFTPLPDDSSLTKAPPVNYSQLADQGVDVKEPLPQSTVWPVDNPTQPVFFTFLLFTEAKAFNSSTNEVPGIN